MSSIDVAKTQEEAAKAKLLPEPKGYRMLCAVPYVEEEFEGGLIKADETRKVERRRSKCPIQTLWNTLKQNSRRSAF